MSTLREAVAAIKAGDKETGRRLLQEVLADDPLNENAWLWMTKVMDSRAERIKCLKRVLEINPDNEVAQLSLQKLQQADAPGQIKKLPPSAKKTYAVKQSRRGGFWLIAGLGTLIFCCGGLFCFSALSSNPRQADLSATGTPGLAATSTQAPEATPVPTQVVPPTPASPPTPALSSAEAAYFETIASELDLLGQAFTEISRLTLSPQLSSQEWQIDVTTQIILVQNSHQKLVSMDPPANLAGVHAQLIDATEACNQAVTFLKQGIDEVDSTVLATANSWMETCGLKIDSLPREMAEELQQIK